MSTLEITTRDTTTGPVLEVCGELDYATATELREVLTTLTLQPGQHLLRGISAPIAARKYAHTSRPEIALTAVPAPILHITGLDQIFTVGSDRALRSDPRRRALLPLRPEPDWTGGTSRARGLRARVDARWPVSDVRARSWRRRRTVGPRPGTAG